MSISEFIYRWFPTKPKYRATRCGAGTCTKCGAPVLGHRRDCDWWECVNCGVDGAGEGSHEGYEFIKALRDRTPKKVEPLR